MKIKAMYATVPRYFWNLLFILFLAVFAIASGVLLGGDQSPIVRLACALCGSIALHAGHVGGVFSTAQCGLRSWHGPCSRKRLFSQVCGMLVLFSLILVVTITFLQARDMARIANVGSELKVYGLALLEYAEANHKTLPPHTGRKRIDSYLAPYRPISTLSRDTGFGKPFVWCNALSGLRLSDIEKPAGVIVAYTCEPAGSYGYAALYLDGHVKYLRQKQLREQLRERENLLAPAIQANAKRERTGLPPATEGK